MRFYVVGECPVCIGSGDLLALLSKKDGSFFCYCPACGLAWSDVPSEINEMHSIDDVAPHGAVAARLDDLKSLGINYLGVTEEYKNIDDIT